MCRYLMRIVLFLKKFQKFISGTRRDIKNRNGTFLGDTMGSIFPNFDWKKIIFSRSKVVFQTILAPPCKQLSDIHFLFSCCAFFTWVPISEILIPVPYTLAIYRNYNLNSILYSSVSYRRYYNIPQYYYIIII